MEAFRHSGGLLFGEGRDEEHTVLPRAKPSPAVAAPKRPWEPDQSPQPEYPRCVFSLMNAIRDSREMYFRLPSFVCSMSPRFVSS